MPGLAQPAASADQAEARLRILGKWYSRAQVEAEFQHIRQTYGMDPSSEKMLPLADMKAELVKGRVIEVAGARLVLLLQAEKKEKKEEGEEEEEAETEKDYATVIRSGSYAIGASIEARAVRVMGTYSYRSRSGKRFSIPQYRDVSLERTRFLTALREGYPFEDLKVVQYPEEKETLEEERKRNPTNFQKRPSLKRRKQFDAGARATGY